MDAFKKIAKDFKNPGEIKFVQWEHKLIWKGVNIYHQVHNIIKAASNKQSFLEGFNIGRIIEISELPIEARLALGQNEDPIDDNPDTSYTFFNSFWDKAFGLKVNLQECRQNTKIYHEAILKAFKHMVGPVRRTELIQGAMIIQYSIEEISNELIQDCQNSKGELVKGVSTMESQEWLDSWHKTMRAVRDTLLFHPIESVQAGRQI